MKGFEKYVAIKSRSSGTGVDCAVVVVSCRAMRMHGEALLGSTSATRLQTLEKGCVNLRRHIRNIRTHYGTPVVVAITRPTDDTDEEHRLVAAIAAEEGAAACVPAFNWSRGGEGAAKLAQAVVDATANKPTPQLRQLYE